MIEEVAKATVPDSFLDSEYYQLVEGSVYDGDTLRVKRCGEQCEELKSGCVASMPLRKTSSLVLKPVTT